MTEFQQQVIDLVNEGLAVSEIAKQLKRNTSSVSSVVKRFNLSPKKYYENTVNHEYFDVIDTEDKAYLLGFFIADGCINKDTARSHGRFAVSQSIDDLEIVEAFSKYINVPSPISSIEYQSGAENRKKQIRLRWTSAHMRDSLKNLYNITENKTLDSEFIFPIETIPEDLQRHFVRGFIDGDGYLGNNGELNNFIASIVGTSSKFLETIGNLVNTATGMTYNVRKVSGKTCEYYVLRWSCNRINKFEKITKLNTYLYKNASIYLKRKKEKIDAYLEYRANALDNTNAQCNA